MKKLLLLFISLIFFFGCNGIKQEDYDAIESKLNLTLDQLTLCKEELKEIKNTPQQRLLNAQKIESSDLVLAEKLFRELIEKFPKSNEALYAKDFINKVEKERERIRAEKEKAEKEKKEEEIRIKKLGFKILKENLKIKHEGLVMEFSKIKMSKRFVFDRYGDRYYYRDAIRGTKYLTATLKVTSKFNSPKLLPIYVYQLKEGELQLISAGPVQYEFYRWEDYGSYLGNYADYNNSFLQNEAVKFSIGEALHESDNLKDFPIFLMVKKEECVLREEKRFNNPPVKYSTTTCKRDMVLDVEKAKNDYFVVKILNKEKL
tara:strand:- start:76 stop:1026 length:951 start_codon:yes stop_codon:yes gene_type:complete